MSVTDRYRRNRKSKSQSKTVWLIAGLGFLLLCLIVGLANLPKTPKQLQQETSTEQDEIIERARQWREASPNPATENRPVTTGTRFTPRQYEQLLACNEDFVEAILGVSGTESASSGDFKTMTYTDDYGAIITVSYRYQRFILDKKEWRLVSKAQIGVQ